NKSRIVDRYELPGFKSPKENRQPNPADTEPGYRCDPGYMKTVLIKRWRDLPPNIGDVRNENDRCDGNKRMRTQFRLPKQQQEKRANEMKNEEPKRDHLPAVGDPMQVPRNLVRQVAG